MANPGLVGCALAFSCPAAGWLCAWATAPHTAATATIPNPYGPAGQGIYQAASADYRTFFVGYLTHHKEIIYGFRLTGSGKVSGFSPVKGGALANVQSDAMAASPDGSRRT